MCSKMDMSDKLSPQPTSFTFLETLYTTFRKAFKAIKQLTSYAYLPLEIVSKVKSLDKSHLNNSCQYL